MWMKKIINEGNQIHSFLSSSSSGTVINYGWGSGSDFLTSYGSGSGSTSQKVMVPTVPVPVPVPQHCQRRYFLATTWFAVLFTVIVEIVELEVRWVMAGSGHSRRPEIRSNCTISCWILGLLSSSPLLARLMNRKRGESWPEVVIRTGNKVQLHHMLVNSWFAVLFTVIVEIVEPEVRWVMAGIRHSRTGSEVSYGRKWVFRTGNEVGLVLHVW